MGFISRLKGGLSKTREGLLYRLGGLIGSTRELDEEFWEELEAILIQADAGVEAATFLVDAVRERARREKLQEAGEVQRILQEEIAVLLETAQVDLDLSGEPPHVILVVGVNGTGKTTTVAKLAYRLKQDGNKVLLAAADTFRAAAGEQLEVWAQRVGVGLVRHQEGADPAAVVYDALQAARARKQDILLVDTAGRLHNKANLMEELKKICRVIQREQAGEPREVLLVMDATTGQNGLSQARLFREAVGITGVVLAKLDGTAKGGVVLAVQRSIGLPVKFIGLGEKLEDLRPFQARAFAAALLEGEVEEGTGI